MIISMRRDCLIVYFFFFNDTATTEIYTLSLHDALPISRRDDRQPVHMSSKLPALTCVNAPGAGRSVYWLAIKSSAFLDRKSTRLNSSHANISYAVFCLKKKKK